MHELGLAEGIVAVALDVARGERVERVRVSVGALQRVVPDSLRFCFGLAATDTLASAATLDVEETAGADVTVDAVKVSSGWRHRPDTTHAVTEAG